MQAVEMGKTPPRQQSVGPSREASPLELLFERAQALHTQGGLSEAAQLYRTVLQYNPGHVGSLHNLAVLCFQQCRYDEAIAQTRELVRLRPELAIAHHTLAVALRHVDHLEEAEACCREALRLQPDYSEAYNTLGIVLTAQRRWIEAEACCRAALHLAPGYAEAYNNLGVVLAALNRPEEAETCYREALRLRPGNPSAINNLCAIVAARGGLKEAEVLYREAVRLAPQNAEAHSRLGAALLALGRAAEAELSCRQALCLDPWHAEARNSFENALSLQQKPGEAPASIGADRPEEPDEGDIRRAHLPVASSVPDLQGIVVATSIPPELSRRELGREVGHLYQIECIRSWTEAGFRILSLNPPEEIAWLSNQYPHVRFIPVTRDASWLSGRRNPFVPDLLIELASQPEPIVGIINSDIRLEAPGRWPGMIAADVYNSVLLGQRCDVRLRSSVVGPRYPHGFDFFFFGRDAAKEVSENAPAFALGLPWWDYWLPLALRFTGRQLRVRDRPRVFHLAHATAYDLNIWRHLASDFADWVGAAAGSPGIALSHGLSRVVELCRGTRLRRQTDSTEGDDQRHLLSALCCAAIRGVDGQKEWLEGDEEWLPIMETGVAGLRIDDCLVRIKPGKFGHVVYGPRVYLPPGRYCCRVRLEAELPLPSASPTAADDDGSAATLEIRCSNGTLRLAIQQLYHQDFDRCEHELSFTLTEFMSLPPTSLVEVRVWTQGLIAGAITSVTVTRLAIN